MSTTRSDGRASNMHDVARAAGVSHQTVSRVLNGSPHVAGSTRARVEAAIADLDYRPNPLARALILNRTQLIGVIAPHSLEYGPATKLESIEVTASQNGYDTVIVPTDIRTPDGIRTGIERLARLAVDGAIMILPFHHAVQTLRDITVPVPYVAVLSEDGREHTTGTIGLSPASTVPDEGPALVVRHLISLGHRRILHIAGPESWTAAESRLEGNRLAMRQAGLQPLESLRGDWSAKLGYELGMVALGDDTVTAIFAANDQTALGVLQAADEVGLSVPDDISVVGYDDVPEAGYYHPPLTTVRKDNESVGQRAVHDLISSITGGQSGATISPSPGQLVVRASTAPARQRRPS